MHLYCRKCNIPITKELELLLDKDLLSEMDGEPHVPEGFYTISDGEYFTGSEGQMLIYCSDLINCTYHPDKTRLNGCCGLAGLVGPNRVCINGHEIGTEVSDCWVANAVKILDYATNTMTSK